MATACRGTIKTSYCNGTITSDMLTGTRSDGRVGVVFVMFDSGGSTEHGGCVEVVVAGGHVGISGKVRRVVSKHVNLLCVYKF